MTYRLPLTLRMLFHGLRSISLVTILLVVAWVTLVPASAAERAALGAPIGTERPNGLVTMRVARAMVHFAPDRAARMLSRASDGELSPQLAAMILRDLAAGPVARRDNFEEVTAAPAATTRQVGDAKFVQVGPD